MTNTQPRRRDNSEPGHPTEFSARIFTHPEVSLSTARSCTEGCGEVAQYRDANVPRGYRTAGDAAYCSAHAAEHAADGGSIEPLPRPQRDGETLVWAVEGDDHEVELVTATTPEEALELALEAFRSRYDEDDSDDADADGDDRYSADLLTIAGAFRGNGDGYTDELDFVPHNDIDENDAYRALENVL